jgi:FkbM family methyltransferase
MNKFSHKIRSTLRKFGFDIVKYHPSIHYLARRKKFLGEFNIDLVLDVGANVGQYAVQLRQELGYKGQLVSFEPMSVAYETLERRSSKDPLWQAYNFALGDSDNYVDINIAGNSYSSSLMDMLDSHVKAAPESAYISKENIRIQTLDAVFDGVCSSFKDVYLKIDTQGFERKVLAGATKSLSRIDTVQMEMSLIPLYENEAVFSEMHAYMEEIGYTLVAIEPGFSNSDTGQMLQVDGIYRRFH